MSYKTNTVGGIAPESFNTDFELVDSSDVSGTYTNNKTLSYDSSSSSWTPADMPSGDLGSAGSSYHSQTGASWRGSGGATYAYVADSGANPPIELMQACTGPGGLVFNIPTGHTKYNWGLYQSWYTSTVPRFSGFFVPAGTWRCRATVPGTPYASTGYAVVRWCTGGAAGSAPTTAGLTQVGPHFYHAIEKGRFCHVPTYIITTTASSTLIGLEFVSGDSFQFGETTNWAKYHTFHVTKIG